MAPLLLRSEGFSPVSNRCVELVPVCFSRDPPALGLVSMHHIELQYGLRNHADVNDAHDLSVIADHGGVGLIVEL